MNKMELCVEATSDQVFLEDLRASLVAPLVRNPPAMQEMQFNSWLGKISTGEGVGYPLQHGSVSKESACNVGDLGSIPWLGRSPGGGRGNPLQYSCLENPRGQRSLAGCSPWSHKESDTTEWLSTAWKTSGKPEEWVCTLRSISPFCCTCPPNPPVSPQPL